MGIEEASKKASQPQLVKFEGAFKLAEQWVNHMSKLEEDDKSTKLKVEGRPPRLGIGAAVSRESKRVVHSNDPVERKLRAKLDGDKKRVVKNAEEEFASSAKDGSSNGDSDDEELESKTKAFAKRRPAKLMSSPQAKKKHK